MSESTITPNFTGEVQLAGWSESHNGGCKVILWLADSADLDAFRMMTVRKGNQAGQRLMAVFVEIGEDEKPVPPQQPAAPQQPKGGPLARNAAQVCNGPGFQRFASVKLIPRPPGMSDIDVAAEYMRQRCGIDSRAELDNSTAAAQRFRALMHEFRTWLETHEANA